MRKRKAKETTWDIFTIVSEISDEIMVWKTEAGNCYNTYKNHVHGKNEQSQDLFVRSETAGKFPKMYLLGTCQGTYKEAFRQCVAWTKYFLDRGYTSISYKSLTMYAEDMLDETKEVYEQIKDIPVEQVLSEENLVVETYNRRGKKPSEKKESITICLKPDEYDQIVKRAKQLRLSMSRYCRNMALYGHIVTMEPPMIEDQIRTARESIIVLRQLLYTIYVNGKYFPADLENIQKAVDRIIETQREVYKAIDKNTREVLKLLPK